MRTHEVSLTKEELDLLVLWKLSCEDLARTEEGCVKCPFRDACLVLCEGISRCMGGDVREILLENF